MPRIPLSRRRAALLLSAIFIALASPAIAADLPSVIKIGVLTDMSGSTADAAGQGSVVAARLAAEDFGDRVAGSKIEVVGGNFQGKTDLAMSIARQWFDQEGADAVADLPFSQTALAISALGQQKDRAVLIGSGTTSDLTGKACNAVTTQWTDDTYALANGTARAVTRAGKKTWFFLTTDYAFGTAMQRDATQAVEAEGGTVVGAVRHPPFGSDLGAFISQAMASKAQVVGLANVGSDTTNSIKEAASFGLTRNGQVLAGLLVFINDVHALGLPVAQNLLITSGYYWNQNDASRRFADRFRARMGRPPSKSQAAVYASVVHWLKAVASTHSVSGEVTTRAMKAMPAEYLGQQATIRPDGRVLYDLALYQVKTPAESHGPWDYYKQVATLSRDEAFRPIAESGCPADKR
ncbi:MAG: ABC transporter substrate-binding protein [Acetobacteraceae bacterium]